MLIDEVKISISSASVLRDFLVGIGKSSSDKVIASSLLITTGGVCSIVWPCPFCCSNSLFRTADLAFGVFSENDEKSTSVIRNQYLRYRKYTGYI